MKFEDVNLIKVENFSNFTDLSIEIYNYHNQEVTIDIEDADSYEITINNFNITSHNALNLKFAFKKYKIKIQRLLLKCAELFYSGGAEVKLLNINTYANNLVLCEEAADEIVVKAIENEDDKIIKDLLQGVEIIPGCGEHSLDPDLSYAQGAGLSLKELKEALPNMRWVAPVASWFATSLDIKNCKIIPGIDEKYKAYDWQVDNFNRSNAYRISYDEDGVISYGGTIDDTSVIKFLDLAKTHNLKIMFYPLIMVDLKDKPWRGHITGNALDVELFYETQYKPFILHYAKLVKNRVDAFIIGSELVRLTSIRDEAGKFPFVEKLIILAREVKEILGKEVKLTYAADWSEYHTAGGTERPLDYLWSSVDIDLVGIDAYFPLTSSDKSDISITEIKKGWVSGEGYDGYIDGNGKIISYNDEPWNAWKNLKYWWESEHWVGNEKTPWQPKMKPIWFTEFGFPSIDKAPNRPNVFYNPKCTDGGIPTYSNGKSDFAIQKRSLRATLEFWHNSEIVENMICWAWDARGIGWQDLGYYADSYLWEYGHWIDGKIALPQHLNLSRIGSGSFLKIDADAINLTGCDIHFSEECIITTKGGLFIYGSTIESKKIKISGGNVLFDHSDLKAYESLLVLSEKDIELVSRTEGIFQNYYKGGKYEYRDTIYNVKLCKISAGSIELKATEACRFEGSIINADLFLSNVGSLYLKPVIVTNTYEEIFEGKEKWYGGKQSSVDIRKEEVAYQVIINAKVIELEIANIFEAIGAKIRTEKCNWHAKEYNFSGIALDDTHEHKHKEVRLLSKTKSGYENSHRRIAGVEIIIAGRGFIVVGDCLSLKATLMQADELEIVARSIEISGMIGNHVNAIYKNELGFRAAITCKSGELSCGLGLYGKIQESEIYAEYLVPSIIAGCRYIKINADSLTQESSFLRGGFGTINLGSWHTTTRVLESYVNRSEVEANIGLSIGVKENVTSTILGLKNTYKSITDTSDNSFGGINAVSNIVGSFNDVVNLLGGNVAQAGVWLNCNLNVREASYSRTSYARSGVSLDVAEVEIGGNRYDYIPEAAIGLNKVPEDEAHSRYSQTGIGISTGGFQLSHYQERDGVGFGGGLGGSFDGFKNTQARVQYRRENEHLEVKYAPLRQEEVTRAFGGGRSPSFEQKKRDIE
jgi:hypothetical protein